LEFKGNTLTAVKNGSTLLEAGSNYIVNGNQLTITKAYLATLLKGTAQLTFEFSAGQPQTLTITVVDTTPVDNGGTDGGNTGGTDGGNTGGTDGGNTGGTDGGNTGGTNGGNNGGSNAGNTGGTNGGSTGSSTVGNVGSSNGGSTSGSDTGGTQEGKTELKDIAGHWAEAAIRKAVEKGLVMGYKDHSFKPNAAITRAEFAVMLTRVLTVEGDGKQPSFKDEANIASWAKEALEKAVRAGILGGYTDGTLRPNGGLTRAELAVMIARALKLDEQKDAAASFTDYANLPEWAKGAIGAVVAKGLMQGKEGGKFDFSEVATRAEVTVILVRVLELK